MSKRKYIGRRQRRKWLFSPQPLLNAMQRAVAERLIADVARDLFRPVYAMPPLVILPPEPDRSVWRWYMHYGSPDLRCKGLYTHGI